MRDSQCKKQECQNHRMSTFKKGFTAVKKTTPNNHVLNQNKTKKEVI